MQRGALPKRKLTLVLSSRSNELIANEGELTEENSGDDWRKEMARCARFQALLLDSFFLEILSIEAELRGHTEDLRVSSIAGERTWPELGFWVCEGIRERKEIGGGGGLLGFPVAIDVVLQALEGGGSNLGVAERRGDATEQLPPSGG
jgi:hypothetical protein